MQGQKTVYKPTTQLLKCHMDGRNVVEARVVSSMKGKDFSDDGEKCFCRKLWQLSS